MAKLDWLTARPVAHRGLHENAAGVIENTASAFRAAIEGGFSIETDVQITADGEAMVHHDFALGRLTLGDLCDLVGGRVPLVIELKSRFDGNLALVQRAAEVLKSYPGPAVLMSFDPAPVAALREIARTLPRGIVAERHYVDPEWSDLSDSQKRSLAFLTPAPRTRPHFVAYHVTDLPSPGPWIARNVLRLPLLAWTVRSAEDRTRARRWADQMIFEGFRP